jgi:sec-independent protein translocase protein TatA
MRWKNNQGQRSMLQTIKTMRGKMFTGLFQPMHLLIILVIVMIIFDPGKLPELGNSLGKAIRDFKKEMNVSDKRPDSTPNMKKTE